MTARQINILLAALLLFSLTAGIIFAFKNFGLRHDLGTTNGQLRRANRDLQHSRDSTQTAEARYEVLKMSMAHKVIELRDSVRDGRVEHARLKKANEKSKQVHIDRAIPNPELDSAVTRFIVAHQH